MLFPVTGIYETHLSVSDRRRSVDFYSNVLGMPVAREITERDVTFLWLSEAQTGMLGIWGKDSASSPVTGKEHFAFAVALSVISSAIKVLTDNNITPLDMDSAPISEPIVISWMPAVSVYFKDPDNHSLELIHWLDQSPQPDLGVVALSEWIERYPILAIK